MADSVGSGFPSTGINKGHVFYDLDQESLWTYLGGIPRLVSSWRLLSGRFNEQPDTTLWGLLQAGAQWFLTSDSLYYGWNGSSIIALGAGSEVVAPVTNVLILFGPNAIPQALGADAPINDILALITSSSQTPQGGPIILRANTEILNAPAANPVVTISIAKNGVALPNATRVVTMQAQSRTTIAVETVDLDAAVDDQYSIRASTTIPGVSHQITAGQTEFVVQTLGQSVATVATLEE